MVNITVSYFVSKFNVISEQCTLPTNIRGAWISSEKNALTFATSSMDGYVVSTYSTSTFTCIESSGTQYLFK